MSVEFVGAVPPRPGSKPLPPIGPPLQPAFIADLALRYEQSPFVTVWIGQSSTSVDAVVVVQAVLAAASQLRVAVTVPPELLEPVGAAPAAAERLADYQVAGGTQFQPRGLDPAADVCLHAAVAQAMSWTLVSDHGSAHVNIA